MPPFAYAIKIDRKYQTIRYQDEHDVENYVLSIAQLRELGVGDDDAFWVRDNETNVYTVIVHKARLETKSERATRVSKEIRYMREYKKRKLGKGA